MRSRLHHAHGELESKLTALSLLVGDGSQGPLGMEGMADILQKLQATADFCQINSNRPDAVAPAVDSAHAIISGIESCSQRCEAAV